MNRDAAQSVGNGRLLSTLQLINKIASFQSQSPVRFAMPLLSKTGALEMAISRESVFQWLPCGTSMLPTRLVLSQSQLFVAHVTYPGISFLASAYAGTDV